MITTGTMNILRAVEENEYEVDWSHRTPIPNIERDEKGNITLYGEDTGGVLYYIVLDDNAAQVIATLVTNELVD